MEFERRPSIFIDPCPFALVVLRHQGFAFTVAAARPPTPPKEPWVPGTIPPPARAMYVAEIAESLGEVLGWSGLDVNVARSDDESPRTTITVVIDGTNLVDFDDDSLRSHLARAADIGADVVIRLAE